MKKIILSALMVSALFVTTNTMAQVSFGPKIGINIANMHDHAKGNNIETDFKSVVGFQAGGMMNAQINEYFAIRPELLFNRMGGKGSINTGFFSATSTFHTNYLSLPVNFVGQYPISDKFKLQAFVGPYAALGLGGKLKSESSFGADQTNTIKMKKDPGNANDNNYYLNQWDFGLNFGLGFQFSSLVFTANYGLGLTNMESHYSNSTNEDNRGNAHVLTNRNITFGIAYLFGAK